ncbi:WecB/TagA/CpsF family glycosyltransferase [Parabacteroides bouchesdurhonensis]|uniref:WecB/TagA/CpsF family glycosyltransferase n=1 Tax=Parabacteroides bouchesdurhonensis TaxID=1936995 RepID=UPI000E4CCF6A|nr:WecB/TagA/CpsF family glycosyltransferase [Parabacteroides bouchesdurhonensis]RHJ95232.1 glycosyltransferase [Bacteroides sp. AM07-16]
MKEYFNVFLEFDKEKVHQIIKNAIKENKNGYVCAIESNNLAVANKDKAFNEVVNKSLVNVCDGSNIAWLLGKIHKKNFSSYTGSDLFCHFIELRQYKQYFIGNTDDILDKLRYELSLIDVTIVDMPFKSLPFRKVEDFNYKEIAEDINLYAPDIIWVSLGAPKQEFFMANLSPYITKGVMFGVGAAFNFMAKTGSVRRAPKWMRDLRLEWLYRAFEEPRKNVPRYWNFIKLLPKLVYNECVSR